MKRVLFNAKIISKGDLKIEKYKSSIADEILERKLKGKGAVLIEGPKWCGKTTTAVQISKSVLYIADPANKEQNLTLADINPALLLTGDTPRLIDEWQLASKLWDAIRFEVDHRREEGQFILTCSAVPVDREKIAHTGTGRFSWLLMRPMTLYESGESTGTVSLEDIALDSTFDYYDAIINSDISRVDGVNRNPERVKNLMRSYARNIGSQASIETIKNDMINNDSFALDTDTVFSYINALKKYL